MSFDIRVYKIRDCSKQFIDNDDCTHGTLGPVLFTTKKLEVAQRKSRELRVSYQTCVYSFKDKAAYGEYIAKNGRLQLVPAGTGERYAINR